MPQISYADPRLPAGYNGDVDTSLVSDRISLVNSAPQAAQVTTVTVTGATNNKTYTVTLNEIPISYLSDGSASIAEIAAGLAAAISAEPAVSGLVSAAATSTTVVVTSRFPGIGFTLTESDSELTVATSPANASASPIPFGRGIVRVEPGDYSFPGNAGQCRLPVAADFSGAQAILSFTAANSQPYSVSIITDAETVVASITSDGSATALEIATALITPINAASAGITASITDTDKLLIQADPGVNFQIGNTFAGTGGAIAIVSYSPADAPKVYAAERSDRFDDLQRAQAGLTEAGYPGNYAVAALVVGRMIVPTEAACAAGDPVYLRVSADGALDQLGKWSNAAGTGLVKINGYRWHKPISASQAWLQLNP
jgi:hypothetical protein